MLSYRSKPHCGGQGVYIRHLSRELVRLGHEVEVFSGQPYPDLDEGVRLTKVPSLDLYREPDPFRVPKLREFRDRIDVEEFLTMCTAGFPEPKTFGSRIARLMEERAGDFDIAHDNQVLAPGVLELESYGLPVVATIHHPITMDRRIDLQTAPNWRKRMTLRRWYGFLRMQTKVARRLRKVLTPSESSRRDVARDFGVDPDRMQTILLGVDDVFAPPTAPRVPGRILAMASADAPMKGIATLLEAFAKLSVEREVSLVLVTRPEPGGRTEQLIDQPRHRRQGHLRQRRHRRGARRGDGLRRGGVRAVALRGLLAADRRADGVRDAAGGLARRCDPRGRRPRRRVRRPRHAGRRRRAGAGASPRCSTTPSGVRRWARPGVRASRSCSAGVRSPRPPPPPTRRPSPTSAASRVRASRRRATVLTVDFDRLGLRPGERVLDMGCGAGRHAFEMYKRGADVIAFDQ